MDTNTIIPAETITIGPEALGAEGSSPIAVKPEISIKGTTFTIKLYIKIPAASGDTKTFTLSHANNWSDSHSYFKWPEKTDVSISADRKYKRIHVRVAPPIIKPIDKYIPYSAIELPTNFDMWRPHSGTELTTLQRAMDKTKPVGKSPGINISVDHSAVAERCAFLGDEKYGEKATKALQSGRPSGLQATEGGNVLFALGILGDASAYVGGSLGGGLWWTDDAQCGLYGGIGAQMGAIVGTNLQLVYTVVFAQGGNSAMENFKQYHIARGVVGEGPTLSIALLGNIQDLKIYGLMYGGGLGGGTPAGGYVGASRQALLEF